MARKIEDCPVLAEDFALDWLNVLSCADLAVRDGLTELASLYAIGSLKKQELWCSFATKGVTVIQK